MSDALPYTVSFTRVPEWSKMSAYIDSKLSQTAQLQFYKYCEEKWKATPNRKDRDVPSNYYFPDTVKIYLYILVKGAFIRKVQFDL